ncbi:MAG: hypothetical protein U0Q19_17925 [Kineosporiaceae bacterium]
MESHEVRLLTEVEDRHWWYAERRELLRRAVAGMTPGDALDVGAAGGGNTRVLLEHGWRAAALEYGAEGARCVPSVASPYCGVTRRRCRWRRGAWTWWWPSTSSSTWTTTRPPR